MAMPNSYQDREKQAWEEKPAGSGKPAKRVYAVSSASDPVFVTFTTAGETKLFFNDHTAVASGVDQVVVSYTVPAGKTFLLQEIAGSSCNRSLFWVEIDGVTVKTKRTYHADFNADFNFYELELTAGQVVRLLARHNRPTTADVEGSIVGGEI